MNRKLFLFALSLVLMASAAYSQTFESVSFPAAVGGNDNFQPVIGATFGVSLSGGNGSLTITSEYGEQVFHDGNLTENVQIPIAEGISVYPNPADYVVNIVVSEASNLGDAQNVEFYDMSGKLVLTRSLNGQEGEFSVDVSVLKAGTYLMKIGTATASMVKGN